MVKTSQVIVHGQIESNIVENTTFQCACGGETFVLLESDNVWLDADNDEYPEREVREYQMSDAITEAPLLRAYTCICYVIILFTYIYIYIYI